MLINKIGGISRDASDIMKGFLILLIILGHNSILSPLMPATDYFLRSFRTPLFFMLPWFYLAKAPTLSKIAKRSSKMWFWYFAFFILQVVLYNLLFDVTFSLSETVKAFFLGGHKLLKGVTGYMYLWFMPAFFVAMLVRDLYTIANKKWRIAMIVLSLGVVAYFAFCSYTDYIAIYQGLFFAALGIVASQFALPEHTSYRWSIVFGFVVCSIMMFIGATKAYVKPFMPIIAFLALWVIIECGKKYMEWLKPLGHMSLFIYLTHPLIFQFLLRVVPDHYLSQCWYGIVIYVITVVVSIAVSWCMQKIINITPVLKKCL